MILGPSCSILDVGPRCPKNYGPSCLGPRFYWAEWSCPSCLWAELSVIRCVRVGDPWRICEKQRCRMASVSAHQDLCCSLPGLYYKNLDEQVRQTRFWFVRKCESF